MAAESVPDAQRLARCKEQWVRLLEEALPELESPRGAELDLVVEPATCSPVEQRGAGAAASTWGETGPCEASASSAGPHLEAESSWRGPAEGPGSFLALGLERLFGERPCRQDDASSLGTQASDRNNREAATAFRVQVPKQYPGVQYRKSKNLNDRYPRYAKLGTLVTGQVEDDGEWLRISDQVFLPMKVNGIQILEPDAIGASKVEASKSIKSLWFACSQGNHGEEQEVVTDMKETN